jgi:hypothetical protein
MTAATAPISSPTASDALLVIDVQRDFCRGGALEVPDGDQVVPVINTRRTIAPLPPRIRAGRRSR